MFMEKFYLLLHSVTLYT